MKEFELTFIGIDFWDRPVYKDQNGTIWKNTNFNVDMAAYHTSSNNKFEGEPDMPMDVLYPDHSVKIKETD